MQQAPVIEDIPKTKQWLGGDLYGCFSSTQVNICRSLYELIISLAL